MVPLKEEDNRPLARICLIHSRISYPREFEWNVKQSPYHYVIVE